MPNIFDPDFDQERDAEGFSRRRAFVGRQAGADKLGASVWEIQPGEAAYPFHFLDQPWRRAGTDALSEHDR